MSHDHDPEMYLRDINEAAEAIVAYTAGATFEDYERTRLLRSAVEREFTIIGEAVRQLARHSAETVEGISDYRDIIGFRIVLTHDYRSVENDTVWDAIQTDIPQLIRQTRALLDAFDEAQAGSGGDDAD